MEASAKKEKRKLEQIINTYFTTPIQPPLYTFFSSTSRNKTLSNQKGYESDSEESEESSSTITEEPRSNASAQKLSLEKQKVAKEKLAELNDLYYIAQDLQLAKKLKALEDNSEVIHYDSPGRPSFLQQNPDLPMQLHSCIEFGSTAQKRRKEIIKVRTTLHLKTEMEARYKIYMSPIQMMSVSRNEMKDYIDEHCCLSLVKSAQQFVTSFASHSVIILQDDKAKVPLGVPAVGWIFKTIQSDNEPVTIPDYDFPKGSIQKLIPSVYLIIDPEDSSEMLQKGQLSIFICTSSSTHMADILSLLENLDLDQTLKIENEFKPILVLLVDKQSAYNPVERNSNLELRNFNYASEKLRDLWQRNDIHGHKVAVNSIDYKINPFDETFDISWNWIDKHNVEALLAENNRFLPPLTKDRNGHFLSLIHILQYMDKNKLPGYDQNCPSISQKMYSRLTCSTCKQYFSTLAFLTQHKKTSHFSTNRNPKINAITDDYLPPLPYVYVENILNSSISD
ncbi:23577_t:CDS:2, partial [Gigaspora margarita]